MAPERTCIACRSTKPAGELVRYALTDDGAIRSGRTLPGRGAWLCPDEECLRKAVGKSAFDRAFRTRVSPEATHRLLQEITASQTDCGS